MTEAYRVQVCQDRQIKQQRKEKGSYPRRQPNVSCPGIQRQTKKQQNNEEKVYVHADNPMTEAFRVQVCKNKQRKQTKQREKSLCPRRQPCDRDVWCPSMQKQTKTTTKQRRKGLTSTQTTR